VKANNSTEARERTFGKEAGLVMITKIAIAAGDIWLALDVNEGISRNELFERLKSPERPREMLLMALGWLIYQKHVKCVPGKNGGQLFLVGSTVKEGLSHEKSDQNSFAVNVA
jgi:hypothetical protein